MNLNLQTPIEDIHKVGPAYLMRLHKLGIKSVQDLLFHIPSRYEDYSHIKRIADVGINETATIRGKILAIEGERTYKKHMHIIRAIVQDESGAIQAVWFNQPYILNNLKQNMRVVMSGKVALSKDSLVLSSPVYEPLGDEDAETDQTIHTGRLVPVYPETAGLTSRWLRYMIKPLLPLVEKIPEWMPEDILKSHELPKLAEALQEVHFPKDAKEAERAKKRLVFGELFLIQTVALKEKYNLKHEKAPDIPTDIELAKTFVSSLPFKLTDSQRASMWEILQDMAKNSPMNRLLEGDVGSGKTVVAAMAALQTIHAGYQVAFMVPTEILAEQHFKELNRLLCPSGAFRTSWPHVRIAALTSGSHKKNSAKILYEPFHISKERVAKEAQNGEIDMVIGTHALIQETLRFKNLGLIIIDEQHRFGVDQRAALTKKPKGTGRIVPHLLSMTATPIPRTLSLTFFGDLDLSIIKHLPSGRKKIISKIVPPAKRHETYRFIDEEIKRGRQAFVICPLIEESEKMEAKAATKEYEHLQKEIFPHRKIGLLHGKLKPKEKETVMRKFKDKEFDILVSTSVVEVGIDVPNASVMMIEGADRFGLAQLYQFRGRVGRGEHQSYCFLFTDSTAKTTTKRLDALLVAQNSFELAEKDLEIRGPGDFIGNRQSGIPDFTMASLKDLELVKEVRKEVETILTADPTLKRFPPLLEKYEVFRKEIHFE